MTLEDYRKECAWSKNQMARAASIDINTLNKAFRGETVSANTASKIATAISTALDRRVAANEITGLNFR